ncbi:MerR family transcriptional regulator [Metabacillus iocasae]|uniref:DNA-binding transcriptional MerR regulator n=1 Tax=Priestia iocasae TaxID=2291674 RepID=A0ABS2QT79_9BACI|nr:MerR family transcriptional regulator [Metabacillus iocasae]MBM7702232.1 DNA-binding transcriptional MerR regulator [Metabacillus iocasae]
MKTNEVAKILGIHPSTVLKWVKQHDIEPDKNEFGHCEFTENHVEKLQEIQQNRQRQGVVKVIQKEEVIPNEDINAMQRQIEELAAQIHEKQENDSSNEKMTMMQQQLDEVMMHVKKSEASEETLTTSHIESIQQQFDDLMTLVLEKEEESKLNKRLQKQIDELTSRIKQNEAQVVPIQNEHVQDVQKQLDHLLLRMIENEKRIDEKAGEVVTFQILEHRSEIEQLTRTIKKLEGKMEDLQEKLHQYENAQPKQAAPKWRTFLTGIFN